MPNAEWLTARCSQDRWSFALRQAFAIRHSSFVIPVACPETTEDR
jgi:hypothetical protein